MQDSDEFIIQDQDMEKQAVIHQFQKGCGCMDNCYQQFSIDEVFRIRLQMLELEKCERDIFVLGKLQVMARNMDSVSHARKVTAAKRQRVTYNYSYDSWHVCKAAFCFIHNIGEKVLKNLQKHLQEYGVIPREHGNMGRLPHNTFSFKTTRDFIKNYATIFGLPQPAAQRGRAEIAPVYLPANQGYHIVHSKYVESCKAVGKVAAKYHAFRQIWLLCVPHIQFMTPRTDVCQTCEDFRVKIMNSVQEKQKLSYSQQFHKHVALAQMERQYYIDSIKKAEEGLKCAVSDKPTYCHYTFDFAQQLQVPYHARQVGPIFFKVPLKVQLFGICNDGNHKQTNYLFSESETIGPSGSKAHGPNSVISMLHHYLEIHSSHEKKCHLHADNCAAQNKNRYIVGHLVWRVLTKHHHTIILSFMQVGHTRCMVDGNFGGCIATI